MRDFKSPSDFARHLNFLSNAVPRVALTQAREAGVTMASAARGMLGTYQGADRGSPAWLPLSSTTKQRRVKAGFTPDDPLLMSGKLRDSIGSRAAVAPNGASAVVGSDVPYAVMQERGGVTGDGKRVPPRPFLAKAGARTSRGINVTVGEAFALFVAGKTRIR